MARHCKCLHDTLINLQNSHTLHDAFRVWERVKSYRELFQCLRLFLLRLLLFYKPFWSVRGTINFPVLAVVDLNGKYSFRVLHSLRPFSTTPPQIKTLEQIWETYPQNKIKQPLKSVESAPVLDCSNSFSALIGLPAMKAILQVREVSCGEPARCCRSQVLISTSPCHQRNRRVLALRPCRKTTLVDLQLAQLSAELSRGPDQGFISLTYMEWNLSSYPGWRVRLPAG